MRRGHGRSHRLASMRLPDRYAAILLSGDAYQELERLAAERDMRAIDLAREILERVLLEPKGPRILHFVDQRGSSVPSRQGSC